ncbi:MAG: N-acetyltransferase [Chitinophagaceae bacterium]|nr:N-acetyltransferase [Chitinophagaceae bacterium]
MNIITKFTVATEQGIDALLMLTKELTLEKFSSLLEQKVIDNYIAESFNEHALFVEINSMSNQWLVVYVDGNPAGYARITSKGKKPQVLDRKRAIRIADFGVLKKYSEPAIRDSLFAKCFSVCKSYEGAWINEYVGNPLIEFFECKGFVRQQEDYRFDELPLVSVCFIL